MLCRRTVESLEETMGFGFTGAMIMLFRRVDSALRFIGYIGWPLAILQWDARLPSNHLSSTRLIYTQFIHN